MDYGHSVSTWIQHGNICFWRFEDPAHHKFAGWHFSADMTGCDSLLTLLSLVTESGEAVHRTLKLADDLSAAQSRVVGLRHSLQVSCPHRLRIIYRPGDLQCCALNEEADLLIMTLRLECLRRFSDSISRVKKHDGDFSIRCDNAINKRSNLFFWWWLSG